MISCLERVQTGAEDAATMTDATFCFVLKSPPQLVAAGDAVKALLGYARNDFLTASIQLQERIHPEDALLAASLFAPVDKDAAGVLNLRIRHADGRIRCFKVRYAKQCQPKHPPRLELFLEDATKVSEPGDAHLIASFKTLIELTTDYIFLKNRNHVILAASRSVPEFTEAATEAAELVGRTDYDLHPEAVADVAYRLECQALAEGQRVNRFQQLNRQDGTKRWIDNRKYPINGPGGEIVGLLGIAPDITEHIEAELKLRENEKLLQLFVEHAPVALAMFDREMRYLAVSRRWAEDHAIDAQQIVGRSHYEVNPDLPERWKETHRRGLAGETQRVEEDRYRSPGSAMEWIRWQITPWRGADGAVGGIVMFYEDITERKKAEAALRESEESLREAQRIAGLGIHVQDLGAGTSSVSDVLREILGVGPEDELSISDVIALVHPEDRAAVEACFTPEALRKGKPFEVEHRIVRKSDREVRWVRAVGRVETDSQGIPVKLRGTVQDITERKQAESALRESRELLRLFIEHAPVAMAMFDREMRYLAASRRWLEENAPDGQEIIGRCHYEVVPGIPETWKEAHRRGLAGESLRNDEDRIERDDGSVIWNRWAVIPWRTAEGVIGGIILFAEDITQWKRAQMEFAVSKDLLQLFIEHAPAALAMLDREMRYLAVSQRWLEMHELGDADLVGHSHYEFFPELPENWREEHRRCLAGEKMVINERELTLTDGSLHWVRREVLPWRAGDGTVGGIVLFSEDITERKLAEERLRLAATVFTGAREGILIADPQGTILEVNEAFTRITGYAREEVLGKNPRILQSGLQSQDFYKNMWDALHREGLWSGEIWNRTKGGEIYPEMLTIHAIRDAAGQVKQYVSLSTDITEVKKQEEQLELAAHYDALTGLPNRALLADRLRQAMAQTRRRQHLLGVASFDLDGFMAINENFGHASGDALLTAVALRMKRVLHEGDTLARLGGDEFAAIILDLPDRDAGLATCTRMLEAAAEEVAIGGIALRVTASAGVAFYPQPEEADADTLLRQAGQALYEAKLAGKNRYCVFDPSQDLMTRSRLENIEHLRRALAANELVLYYQPKVNMRTGQVIGAEALLRWQHPERGLLPPGLFLPVIEDHPLTVEVGQWVIESVLKQMEAWQESGFDLPVSVNVSAFELQRPDFVGNLCARLAAHPRVKPANLELEVLETSALQNVALSSQVLAACRDAGVLISVDDFGTGYSSLAYLKRLPASVLKIDQSFVRDMLDEPESLTILKVILSLAEAFQRQVIAEGVETVDHGLMLLELGCDCAQGYGIANPMPARELQAWAASWRADPRWVEVPKVQATNRAALFAVAEHRAWYGHLLGYLQGTRPAPPILDAVQCGMNAWLEAQRLSAGGMTPPLQAIETLHRQIHALADEIHTAHAAGRKQDGLGLLRQLRYLHDRCLKRLQPFTRVSPHKTAGSVVLREGDANSGSNEA
jgi:diguanylate cyclase (GGDEF)-like protein/PAS domain S-box-containing protein